MAAKEGETLTQWPTGELWPCRGARGRGGSPHLAGLPPSAWMVRLRPPPPRARRHGRLPRRHQRRECPAAGRGGAGKLGALPWARSGFVAPALACVGQGEAIGGGGAPHRCFVPPQAARRRLEPPLPLAAPSPPSHGPPCVQLCDLFATPMDDPSKPSTLRILHPGFKCARPRAACNRQLPPCMRAPPACAPPCMPPPAPHTRSPHRLGPAAARPAARRHYGGVKTFSGRVTTIQTRDSNPAVRRGAAGAPPAHACMRLCSAPGRACARAPPAEACTLPPHTPCPHCPPTAGAQDAQRGRRGPRAGGGRGRLDALRHGRRPAGGACLPARLVGHRGQRCAAVVVAAWA